jgi:hypothetical protein
MGEIQLQQAIIHVLDSNVGVPVLSRRELELSPEIQHYFEKLIERAMADDGLKEAWFQGDGNRMRERCDRLAGGGDLIEISAEIAGDLYRIMAGQGAIPPADLVCCRFDRNEQAFLGVLKLNYRTGFIHFVATERDGQEVTLVQQKTVLPSESQKPEECFFVDLGEFGIRLLEKEYEIDGEKDFYLSKLLLACEYGLSNREKAKVLDKVTKQIGQKYYSEDVTAVARMRQAVTGKAAEDRPVELDELAGSVFREDPAVRREYLEEIRKAGLVETEVRLPEKLAARKFASQKIETDTGIELQFPAEYFNNKEKIEIINNPDGTLSILIKNVTKIKNK